MRIKNNNPGNIRVGIPWQGLGPPNGPFDNFISLAYGFRALFLNLKAAYYTHNRKTIKDILYAWSPPVGINPQTGQPYTNNTDNYVAFVSSLSGIDPLTPIAFNFDNLSKISIGMTRFEHGIGPLTNEEVNAMEQGYFMAFPNDLPGSGPAVGAPVAVISIILITSIILLT